MLRFRARVLERIMASFCLPTSVLAGLFLLAFQTSLPAQGLLREVYTEIPGNSVSDLVNHPSFPNNPSITNIVSDFFEAPSGFADNYGQRMRGFIVPPLDGEYIFWIASDDNSVLLLSTDEDPANAGTIAQVPGWSGFREWTAFPEQQSPPITLEAGKIYYIEALMKEGTGGDHLSVRWQLPNGTIEEPIPGSRLIPAGTAFTEPVITEQPSTHIVEEGMDAVFRVKVRNLDPIRYQWQRNGRNISGAIFSSYTNRTSQLSQDGDQFRAVLRNDLGTTISREAALFVTPDRHPPMVEEVFSRGPTNVVVRFSELIDPDSAAKSTNFTLNRGATVESSKISADGLGVLLETSSLTEGQVYELGIENVTDRAVARNPVAAGTRVEFLASPFTPDTVGDEPLEVEFKAVSGGADITVTGGNLLGAEDQAHFSYFKRTGDFDVQMRVRSLAGGDPFARAGLMAREDLEPNTRFAATMATPGIQGVFFQYRPEEIPSVPSVLSVPSQAVGSFPVNFPHTWLRLKRVGNRFTGFASHDGRVWVTLGSSRLGDIPDSILLGIVVATQDPEATVTAEVRDFGEFSAQEPTGLFREDVEPPGPSSRNTGLVISEIMYHPSPEFGGEELEFLELFNSQPTFEDIGGYSIQGSLDFTFPEGTTIGAGEYLVIAGKPQAIRNFYGIENVIGGFDDPLPDNQGTVDLFNELGARILHIEYSDDPPWPAAADGAGHSLILARPSYGEGSVLGWDRSDKVGGSPGQSELTIPSPYRRLVINEFLAHTDEPEIDFIELYNRSRQAVDLSGLILSDDPVQRKFRIPEGTVLEGGAYRVFYQDELGFNLDSAGEVVYLVSPDASEVLDAIRFHAQENGVAYGRSPNGAGRLGELTTPTPGAPNALRRIRNVVINEIMFHPISEDDADEYIELLNRGAAPADVGNWRFLDGIDFVIPAGTVIPSGGFLVVAKDAARLIGTYEQLNTQNTVGDYNGVLANSGERIVLAKPDDPDMPEQDFVVVDRVVYGDGGRWGRWADGGGSSLELVDPRGDNALAANWADSDESAKSEWTTIEHTGVLDLGEGAINELQAMLLGGGECLLDEVQVLNASGVPLIANSGFESGLAGWVLQGNHVDSGLGRPGFQSNQALQIRASSGGDNGANRVETDLLVELAEGNTATIRARARWLRGHPLLLLRLHGNYLEAPQSLSVPSELGTPGLPNSRYQPNQGPAIYAVSHHPVLPAASETVIVTAKVHDPDGVENLQLSYRLDPGVSMTELAMRDDGTGGDEVAGDGIFSAQIPGQATGVLAAFHIGSVDRAAEPAASVFPDGFPRQEALVLWGESIPAGSFGSYRLWMTQDHIDTWASRPVMSNEPLDGTIVYNNYRVIYNGAARYRGSPFIRPNYDTPVGNLSAYIVSTPKDDPLLGSDEFNLDWLEQPGRDDTLQREKMAFWVHRQLGAPFSHQRYIHVFVNGVKRGLVYTDSQQPNADYVDSWFVGNDEGEIFKIDDWFEFGDGGVLREFNRDATLQTFLTTGGVKKQARYRWNWEKKFNRRLDDDYSRLFTLVDAMNTGDPDLYTARVNTVVNVDEWTRVFGARHIVADWDGYGYRRGKNMFTYIPSNGRWHMLPWDLDFSLGGGSDGTTRNIFETIDPVIERFYEHPPFRRTYLQVMEKAVRGPLRNELADPVMDANYAAFLANGINVNSPNAIKGWIQSRREYLVSVLSTNTAEFAITSPAESSLETSDNLVEFQGTAPIRLRDLLVNGVSYPVRWTSVTNWVMAVPIKSGVNRLNFSGFDLDGEPVPDTTAHVEVEFTGVEQRPEDFIVINEIMYHPREPDAEFLELFNRSTEQSFDLTNYELDGLDFQFPAGTRIPAQGFLVVVQNPEAFAAAYGDDIPIAGVFNGRLANGGETIRLLAPNGEGTVVDEVTFDDETPWPVQADGQGSSLQLIDPRRDNNRLGNWEAVGQSWEFVSVTGDAGDLSQLQIRVTEPGDLYLDDVMLVEGIVPRVGENLIQNGGFEDPLEPNWQVSDALAESEIQSLVRRSGRSSLHLVASDAVAGMLTENLLQEILPALEADQTYSLSYWYYSGSMPGELIIGVPESNITSRHRLLQNGIGLATPGTENFVRRNLPVFPPLWVNEIQADNESGILDAAQEREPWVELYSASPTALGLRDFYLSNDPADLMRWPFPAGASLASKEFRIVFCDGESAESVASEWHAGFRLDPENGIVLLVRNVNGYPVIVDFLKYAALPADRSIGSFPDGDPHSRQVFANATPGAPNSNEVQSTSIFINEWMASNSTSIADPADGDFEDWFELYNPGATFVDISGFTLSDRLDNPRKFVIPAGTIVPARGYLLVWADEEDEQNGTTSDLHVNFKLSRSGESIGLYAPNGTVIDLVEFGEQLADVSEGRRTDGASPPFVAQIQPTPGASNASGPAPGTVQITDVSLAGNSLTLIWMAEPGHQYQVQYKNNLNAVAWTDLGPPVLADSTVAQITDDTISETNGRIYRIVRLGN